MNGLVCWAVLVALRQTFATHINLSGDGFISYDLSSDSRLNPWQTLVELRFRKIHPTQERIKSYWTQFVQQGRRRRLPTTREHQSEECSRLHEWFFSDLSTGMKGRKWGNKNLS